MDILQILRLNLLSPMVLAFVLGILAVLVKSDLKIPGQVYATISLYLLFAIGYKGGFDLSQSPTANFGGAALAAVVLGAAIPLWSFFILTRAGKLDQPTAIGTAIHYGAVSAATLSACITFLNEAGEVFEGFMPTLYVIMELPAVIVGLMLASSRLGGTRQSPLDALRSALSSKGFLLLGGGVLIGFIAGEPGYAQVSILFVDLFPGILALFLLEMGTLVGQRLEDLSEVGVPLVIFALVMPVLHGTLGVALGALVGLSVGGAMILGTLAASASFITAPAVVETNVRGADVSLPLTIALTISFPFNLTLGLPLYFELAKLFVR